MLAARRRPADADVDAEFRKILGGRLRVLDPDYLSILIAVNWVKSLQGSKGK